MVDYAYVRVRSQFGRPTNFMDSLIEVRHDILPDADDTADYIRRNPIDRACQDQTVLSEHEVNTPFVETTTQGVNHTEGGWPKDVNLAEVEQTTRYRKKLEKDEAYALQLMNIFPLIEHGILQNNAIEIYDNYFEDCTILPSADLLPPAVKVISTFNDRNSIKRSVLSICWHPDGPDRFVAAHCIMKFQQHTPDTSLESYVYRTDDLSIDAVLSSNSPICSVRYSMKEHSAVIGGQYNGQVALWDVRKGQLPTARSSLNLSHHDPVHKVVWTQSKSNTEFFSTSTDGQVIWWDTRKLCQPLEQLWIDPTRQQDPKAAEGGLCLEFDANMPTKFLVGSEAGNAFLFNRKAKSSGEQLAASWKAHIGPVYAIQRNSLMPKTFLTVGDWTARLWSEDVKDSPIWWTAPDMHYHLDACWSVTRPAVFYVAKANGSLDVWDLLLRQKRPALNVLVSDDALMTLEAEQQGQLLAVGTDNGSISILKLSDNLIDVQRNERAIFLASMEREAKREKILEAKARERKINKVLKAEPDTTALQRQIAAEIEDAGEKYLSSVAADRKRLERESLRVRGVTNKQVDAEVEGHQALDEISEEQSQDRDQGVSEHGDNESTAERDKRDSGDKEAGSVVDARQNADEDGAGESSPTENPERHDQNENDAEHGEEQKIGKEDEDDRATEEEEEEEGEEMEEHHDG